MLNQIILVGRISQEITDNTLTLAVQRSYKNAEGIYETDFIPVELFNTIATTTKEYCKKGDIVGIKGRLQTRVITDEETGTKTKEIVIIAERLTFLSSSSPTKDNPNSQTNNMEEGEI